jgi:NAD(P)H-hydrate epimerase
MEKYSSDKEYIAISRQQARRFDDWAINTLGIPGVVLMENAGRSCAELIEEKLAGIVRPKVCLFCGTGNNGGDGYVIARCLLNIGFEVLVVICGQADKVKGDARINLEILKRIGCIIENLDPAEPDAGRKVDLFVNGAGMIVDCLFGTGLDRFLSDSYKALIEKINSQKTPILAVDVPSGLDCNTGRPLGAAVKADYTVTFIALKKGFTVPQAADYTGDIYIASIGIANYFKMLACESGD